MKEKNMRFGELIKSKRLKDPRELSLKDVSSVLNISLSFLSDIEQGRRKPFDDEKIERFCAFLGLTDEDKALLYDLAARERRAVPGDIDPRYFGQQGFAQGGTDRRLCEADQKPLPFPLWRFRNQRLLRLWRRVDRGLPERNFTMSTNLARFRMEW